MPRHGIKGVTQAHPFQFQYAGPNRGNDIQEKLGTFPPQESEPPTGTWTENNGHSLHHPQHQRP